MPENTRTTHHQFPAKHADPYFGPGPAINRWERHGGEPGLRGRVRWWALLPAALANLSRRKACWRDRTSSRTCKPGQRKNCPAAPVAPAPGFPRIAAVAPFRRICVTELLKKTHLAPRVLSWQCLRAAGDLPCIYAHFSSSPAAPTRLLPANIAANPCWLTAGAGYPGDGANGRCVAGTFNTLQRATTSGRLVVDSKFNPTASYWSQDRDEAVISGRARR